MKLSPKLNVQTNRYTFFKSPLMIGQKKKNNVQKLLDKKICCGCGACSVVCPESCIDFVYGKRYNFPSVDQSRCTDCSKCMKVCSGSFLLDGDYDESKSNTFDKDIDCYLIHSTDDEIRLDASSGGFITALILHLIETGQVDGGIVARSDPDRPILSESLIATDRKTLLQCRASRYAPVSSCTVLSQVLQRPGRYVFVGTPCMIESLCKLHEYHPELKDRIVLTVALICAGMDSHTNTRAYLQRYGVDESRVRRISFRGGGWPGRFRAFGDDDEILLDRPLLGDSLVYLVGQDNYLRCWNCVDHWGCMADISVSDPWCDEMVENETKGRSAVMVRTLRGKQAVESAIENGDLKEDRITVDDVLGYNSHLVTDRRHNIYTWAPVYQMLFFGRIKNLGAVFMGLLRGKKIGLRTILRARFNKNYYE